MCFVSTDVHRISLLESDEVHEERGDEDAHVARVLLTELHHYTGNFIIVVLLASRNQAVNMFLELLFRRLKKGRDNLLHRLSRIFVDDVVKLGDVFYECTDFIDRPETHEASEGTQRECDLGLMV